MSTVTDTKTRKMIVSYEVFNVDMESTACAVCFLPSSHGKHASVSQDFTEKF